MSVPSVDINYWAVLVTAVVQMIIGAIWYSPSMGFGKSWMKLAGIKPGKINAEKKKAMTRSYILVFVSALVLNFVLANFVIYMTASGFLEGAFVGFMIWVGFILTSMLGMLLWEGRPFKLYLINVFYYLVSLAITGGILAVWH